MGIILALLAALGWGAGDFVISRVTGAIGPRATLPYMQIAGIGANDRVLLARADVLLVSV